MSTDINMHQQTPTNINRNLKQHLSVTLGVHWCLWVSNFVLCWLEISFGDLWVYLKIFEYFLWMSEILRCVWELSEYFALAKWSKNTVLRAPWNKRFFSPAVSETSKYHKISKCPDISFLKLPELCQIYAFLCPSEENHKTQSVGSLCSHQSPSQVNFLPQCLGGVIYNFNAMIILWQVLIYNKYGIILHLWM